MRQSLNMLCALTVVLPVVACDSVPIPPGADRVNFTRNSADVVGCKPVGSVDRSQGAQNQAVGLGGNTVLDTTDPVSYALGNRAISGVIYHCDGFKVNLQH